MTDPWDMTLTPSTLLLDVGMVKPKPEKNTDDPKL